MSANKAQPAYSKSLAQFAKKSQVAILRVCKVFVQLQLSLVGGLCKPDIVSLNL